MDFDSRQFSFRDGEPSVAIVEIGVNHNGSLELARRMVLEAKRRGAHIVKFQAFVAEEEISKFADKTEYQKETTGSSGGQLEMAKKLELSHGDLRALRAFCLAEQMPFLCTAFESISLRFLVQELGVKVIKIPSSEVTNHPFLAEIARSGVGAILSTGASTLDEVAGAVRVIREAGGEELVLLHCVSAYPADISQINLRAMDTLRRAFHVPVGYSDHTIGIEAPIIAVALGAVCVEKHFTLDCNLEGPDHRASIEPDGLSAMLAGMRAADVALGDGIKRPVSCERANLPLIRKSIVARHDLPAGHVLRGVDLGAKRPLGGIEPFDVDKVIGRVLKDAVVADQPITWDLFA